MEPGATDPSFYPGATEPHVDTSHVSDSEGSRPIVGATDRPHWCGDVDAAQEFAFNPNVSKPLHSKRASNVTLYH